MQGGKQGGKPGGKQGWKTRVESRVESRGGKSGWKAGYQQAPTPNRRVLQASAAHSPAAPRQQQKAASVCFRCLRLTSIDMSCRRRCTSQTCTERRRRRPIASSRPSLSSAGPSACGRGAAGMEVCGDARRGECTQRVVGGRGRGQAGRGSPGARPGGMQTETNQRITTSIQLSVLTGRLTTSTSSL